MADLLYVDIRTYTRFERGENKTIDLLFLNDIAQILETDIVTMMAPHNHLIEKEINNISINQQINNDSDEEIDDRDQIIQHYISLLTHKDVLIKELYELIDKLKQENTAM